MKSDKCAKEMSLESVSVRYEDYKYETEKHLGVWS